MTFFDTLTKVPHAVIIQSTKASLEILNAFNDIINDELVDYSPEEICQVLLRNARDSEGCSIDYTDASATTTIYVGMLLVIDVIINALMNNAHQIDSIEHIFIYDCFDKKHEFKITFNCDDAPVVIDLADTMEHMNQYFIQSVLTNGISTFLSEAPSSDMAWIINVNGHTLHPCLARAIYNCIETYTAQ